MKRYGLIKEGYDSNLNEPTLTVVIGNLTLKEAEKIKRVLEQETSNVYKIEDNSKLIWKIIQENWNTKRGKLMWGIEKSKV